MKKLLLLLLALVSIAVAAHGQGVITQQQIIQWRQGKPAGNPPATYVYMYFDPTTGNLSCLSPNGATTACSTLPTTVTANQCLLSTGVGTGSVWGSCSGTTSSNWNAIVPGTGTISAGTFNVGTGSTLTTTGSGVINASTLGGATFAAPGAIGGGTPGSGAFTTLSASSTVSGAGITALFASPPAVGGTAAAAGTFTTLTATTANLTTINGTTYNGGALAGTFSGSPTFSGNPTFGGTPVFSNVPTLPTQTANTVFAGPTTGAAAAPTFRTIVAADIPTLNQNTTGTASNVTGIVALVNGGTGTAAASAAAAFDALAPTTTQGDLIIRGAAGNTRLAIGTIGLCLVSNGAGANPSWQACATGSVGAGGGLTTGVIPKSTAAFTLADSLESDNGTTLSYTGTGGLNLTAGPLKLTDIVAPTGGAGFGLLYSDSTSHRLTMKNGTGSAVNVVASGVDINTSDQVTATHLAAALPVNQGGTGTTSTLTGLVRGSASAMTAAELSADATTSGSNAVTVVALRNAALPTLAASTGLFYDTAGTLSLQATLPTAAEPAHTGDATNTAGSLAMTVAKINGTAFSGTTGHLVSFASATTPGDSGLIGADVITYHTPATGIARTTSASQALVGSELSGDCATSGSNVVTCTKINGNSVASGVAAHQAMIGTAANTFTFKTIPDCAGSSNALNYTQSTDVFSCLSIATLSNPMTTLGDMINGGASGVVTRLAGPTSGNSPYILTSLPSISTATTPVWSVQGVPVDTESGATFTIQSDAQPTPDRGKIVNLTNNTTSTAVTVPQAGSSGMLSNYPFGMINTGSVIVTATPTTSTVNNNTTLKLIGAVSGHNPEMAFWWSDAAGSTGNWWAAEILPTDANGRLGCEGFMALTGDVTNTAGACATTVGKVNGGSIPTSAGTVGTNSSGQFVAASGLTMNSSGSGAASGTVFNGSAAVTLSWNTIGAAPATASTTVNSQTCTLGSACTIPEQVNNSSLTSQSGWNFLTSVTNAIGITITPSNASTNTIQWEATGSALALGTDASVAGTVQLSNSAGGGAHTIFASAATTTNTIKGFATAPTTGDLISCTTSSTTCTLTDSTVLAANVVTAASNYSNGGLVYSNGTAKTTASSADWAIGGTGNHTLTGGANGILTSAGNGAASASAINVTGTVFTGGIGTTTFPLVYFNQGASGPTTFSTAGTELGINAVSGFTGNFLDFHVNGAASVFSISSAGNTIMAGNLTVSGMTGGPFCVHETAGLLSATASDCGSGGGSSAESSITAPTTTNTITETAAGDWTARAGVETANLTAPWAFGNTNSTNNNTSLGLLVGAAGTSTGGIGLLVYDVSGTGDIARFYSGGSVTSNAYTVGTLEAHITATGALGLGTATCTTFGTGGGLCPAEGTAPTNVSGSDAIYADSTSHELLAATNGATTFGMLNRSMPGAVSLTGQTASIGTATLCAASAGACNVAGQYKLNFNFWGTGTACSAVTAGSVALTVTWTDENGTTHTAIPFPLWDQSKTAIGTSFFFNTALGTESAAGSFIVSTNGTVIQYATTYTACTTGTGSYGIRGTVQRIQ